jgi:hypothetical protein
MVPTKVVVTDTMTNRESTEACLVLFLRLPF